MFPSARSNPDRRTRSVREEGDERDQSGDGPRPRRAASEPRGSALGGGRRRRKASQESVLLLQLPAGHRGRDQREEQRGEEDSDGLARGGHGYRRTRKSCLDWAPGKQGTEGARRRRSVSSSSASRASCGAGGRFGSMWTCGDGSVGGAANLYRWDERNVAVGGGPWGGGLR